MSISSIFQRNDADTAETTTPTGTGTNGLIVNADVSPTAAIAGTKISATFSTPVTVSGTSGASGELRISEATVNGANYISFKVPTNITTNKVWTLPATESSGSNPGVLVSNGSGTLSFSRYAPGAFYSPVGTTNVGQYNLSFALTTGTGNSFFGYSAGLRVTSGNNNVSVGFEAGYNNTTGSYSTFLNSRGSASIAAYSGVVAIGSDSSGGYATVTSDNQFVLGTSNHTYNIPGKVNSTINMSEITASPATPNTGSECRLYMKSDKLIIQYNDSGTVRYKYLDLTGTGVTWVHTTTPP